MEEVAMEIIKKFDSEICLILNSFKFDILIFKLYRYSLLTDAMIATGGKEFLLYVLSSIARANIRG